MNRGQVRRVGLVVALLALLAGPVAAGSPTVSEGTEPVATDEAVSEAIRFRAEQGFSIDESEVREMLSRTRDAQAEPWGTPLSKGELALMDRRAEIQQGLEAVRQYGRDHARAWGGIWLTYPSGATVDGATTVNVNIVGTVDDHRVAVESLLPSGATATFHSVARSDEQLAEAHKPFRAEAQTFFPSLGTRLNLVETNTPENRLDVYVSRLTPAVEAAIISRYGPGVAVFDGGEVHPDACQGSRLTCGPPWRGGVKIVRVDGAGEHWCTLGFVVKKNLAGGGVAYAAWTAGHCGNGEWHRGTANGAVIGTTILNKFVNPTFADVQVIPIVSANKTNLIIDDTAACNPCGERAFTGAAQQAFDGDEFGDTVCNNGYVSGKRCGVIRSTNVDGFTYLGVTLNNQRRATYVRAAGDSGGPVYTTTGSVAAGSHVHFTTIGGVVYPIYTHVWEMSAATNYFVYNGT